MANKTTKKEYFGMIREIVEDLGRNDLIEFVDHELYLLDKKANSKGQTKNQQENEDLKTQIIEELARVNKKVTISELQAESEILAQYSNQKMSALLKQLVDAGEVAKVTEKKKSYFFIAE